MEEEILTRISKEVFPSVEKWDSFIELSKKKQELEKFWYKTFAEYVKKNFNSEKWLCETNGSYHLYWKLVSEKISNTEALSIWFENGKLSIWASSRIYKIDELNNLLHKDYAYESIRRIFKDNEYKDNSPSNEYIFTIVPTISVENLNNENRNWFLGNKPEEFWKELKKIIEQLTNEENTNLFEILNKNCKN